VTICVCAAIPNEKKKKTGVSKRRLVRLEMMSGEMHTRRPVIDQPYPGESLTGRSGLSWRDRQGGMGPSVSFPSSWVAGPSKAKVEKVKSVCLRLCRYLLPGPDGRAAFNCQLLPM
jgi:hypothetical protein